MRERTADLAFDTVFTNQALQGLYISVVFKALYPCDTEFTARRVDLQKQLFVHDQGVFLLDIGLKAAPFWIAHIADGVCRI